ncbi:hypothetical protein [Nocardia arthritidis]|uniref:Uncharacterized protein n=1 Tax=Nocardia arthritidis TaxID=228602 RepID=A0A6G9YMU7_9NOCA|nr:hypothetical protein [Nocardia arthritidis]QIS14528.1 hypothetical protein F5544_33460 [Nocardia arthritidis]
MHATAAWAILAVWPFTRLERSWSFHCGTCVVYRSRELVRPREPGTGGRRWQRIGTPR